MKTIDKKRLGILQDSVNFLDTLDEPVIVQENGIEDKKLSADLQRLAELNKERDSLKESIKSRL